MYPPGYIAKEDGLWLELSSDGKHSERKLCNFFPRIVSEITEDDGLETTKRLRLAGRLADGRPLPEIEIPAKDLPGFNWLLEYWGVDCIVEVGQTNLAHIRYAIQQTAACAERNTVYAVTGWKKIDGQWRFLLPGREGFDVKLDSKLKGYLGADSCSRSDLSAAFSMIDLELAPKKILLPLLAYTFLTPLNHFLKEAGCEPKFVLFLQGRTGTRKSTLAALFLSFSGEFTASGLPLSFQDTANSVLHHLFATKDVLTCVDDFHPDGKANGSRMTATAQAVMRAYGDRVGKGRLTDQSTPMASRPPQGNAILTGEFPPDIGESGAARYLAVEIKDGDVDLDALSLFQEEARAGLFRRCLFGYTEWLRKSFLQSDEKSQDFTTLLREKFESYRAEFAASGVKCHGRVPEIVAWMRLGLEFFFRFLNEEGAVSERETAPLMNDFLEILTDLARQQSDSIEGDRPTHIFLRKLFSLLESGQAMVVSKADPPSSLPNGFVGYEDDDYLYLNCDAAHRAVKRLCDEQSECFSISQRGLLKALAEEGFLLTGKEQSTRTVRIGGKSRRMTWLLKEKAREVAEGL